jgi:hypothetical protein
MSEDERFLAFKEIRSQESSIIHQSAPRLEDADQPAIIH